MTKKSSSVETYRFTPLDIATYIKWSQLSGEQEYRVIASFWKLRKRILSKSCGSSFETYTKRIYLELRLLWERDFVNEHCPLSRALDLDKQPPVLLLKSEAMLELYLKLVALHLWLTEHLPLISVRWPDVLQMTGIKKPSNSLWKRINTAANALQLEISSHENSSYSVDDFILLKSSQFSLKG